MRKVKRVYVAGHRGMVGSALMRLLSTQENVKLITASRKELDLTNQAAVNDFFKGNKIDEVYLAAAKVGGIHANYTYPSEFIYQNLMIESNIIHAAHINDVQKLLFLGSSCIYPKFADQPMKESALLTGTLEPTNEPYAIAKIAGIKLCESYNRQYGRDYRSVMPTNLYGPNDNFHPENSHVIPALMRRFHAARLAANSEVVVWGSGNPRREFLHVDDMAAACRFVMNTEYDLYRKHAPQALSHLNVGFGRDYAIRELADLMCKVTGYKGRLLFDTEKPDGTFRKLLDCESLNNLGWRPEISLEEGLIATYEWYLKNRAL